MRLPPDETWPLPPEPAALYAGDELLPSEATCAVQQPLLEAYAQVQRGLRSPCDPGLAQLASAAGLLEPEPPRERRLVQLPTVAPTLPCDAWLADIAENIVPDLGLSAPDRVLGPWSDESPSRRERVVAGAVMALAPYLAPRVRPVDRWYKDKRNGTEDERAAVRAVDHAPAMAWVADDQARLSPLLPLHPRSQPTGPVRRIPLLDGRALEPLSPGCWLARVFPGPDGWYAGLALPLEATPDPAWLLARMGLELWQLRVSAPDADWRCLLRERGEVLYRSCHEWVWSARR